MFHAVRRAVSRPRPVSVAALLSIVAACGGSAPSYSPAQPVSTPFAVEGTTPIELSGRWVAFLASELETGSAGASTTDLNGDGDALDLVAAAVDMVAREPINVGVAALDLEWVRDELFLVVDEALDGRNWEPVDSGDRIVLINASPRRGDPQFVDVMGVDPDVPFGQLGPVLVSTGDLLVFLGADVPEFGFETNLEVVRYTDPLTSSPVFSNDGDGGLPAELLGAEAGLVFAFVRESLAGRDLDGDGDLADNVFALLDGTGGVDATGYLPPLRSVGTPLSNRALFRASPRGPNDWLVAFTVSEAAWGLNLNGPEPMGFEGHPECFGRVDTDELDDVLFALEFADWAADPTAALPINTRVPAQRRLVMADPFLATLVAEREVANCDMNGDLDTADLVALWIATGFFVGVLNTVADTHAVADVPGGSRGLVEFDRRFVIVADELADQRDLDGDGLFTHELVGWLDPKRFGPWTFQQDNGEFLGASWMAVPRVGEPKLSIAGEERVMGLSINAPTNGGVDLDDLDSFPAYADFQAGDSLEYPLVPYAVPAANAGMATVNGIGFYRVSEAEDERDWNDDGDLDDFVLRRSSLFGSTFTTPMATLNDLARPAVQSATALGALGAAFIADEAAEGPQGTDFNDDGDTTDLVVRWFRL